MINYSLEPGLSKRELELEKEHCGESAGKYPCQVCKMFSMSEPKRYMESQKELYEEYKNGSYIYDICYAQEDGYQPIFC